MVWLRSILFLIRRRSVTDLFRIHVISSPIIRSPIYQLGSTSFFYLRHENLFFLCVSKVNPNVALVFEFMMRFIEILQKTLGKVDENVVKDNFVLIYELADGWIFSCGKPMNAHHLNYRSVWFWVSSEYGPWLFEIADFYRRNSQKQRYRNFLLVFF